MNRLKKIGRLWPLFLICIISAAVLVFSVKSIISSDNSAQVNPSALNISLSQTSSESVTAAPAVSPSSVISEETGSVSTPEPTAQPASSLVENTPQPAVPSAAVTVNNTPLPEAQTAAPSAENTPEPVQQVIIDNTVHEYTDNYVQTQAGSNNEASIASQIINLVNQERNSNGLPGLSYDANLSYAASLRAMEVSSQFSHTRPNGLDCFSAFPDGYIYMAENLASADGIIADSDFASGCVKWWMQSAGHRENILNSNYTCTAVGVYISGGAMYAVQLFGSPQ